MFNKREEARESRPQSSQQTDTAAAAATTPSPASTAGRRAEPAVIGPSIHIDGNLKGEEDLVIDGTVKGTVTLKSNNLTIGDKGRVTADVYAKSIHVQGHMNGDIFAAELVRIGKSAQVRGNIASPRVSLEDGARFKGSIEMDPEAEVLKTAFKSATVKAVPPVSSSTGGEPTAAKSGSAV